MALTKAIRDLLADHDWHSIDEICAAVAAHIRPESALTTYHTKRFTGGRTLSEQITIGKRCFTMLNLSRLAGDKELERAGPRLSPRYRKLHAPIKTYTNWSQQEIADLSLPRKEFLNRYPGRSISARTAKMHDLRKAAPP